MGGKLGILFARAGHDVIFSYSRDRKKLEDLARDAGGKARAGSPAEAAEDADAVLVAIHWSRLKDVLAETGDLSEKVIVSCSLPMNDDDSDLVISHTSSGIEELARIAKAPKVAAAFNTVPSEVLFGVFDGRKRAERPSMVYYGDNAEAKRVAATLVSDVGFEPIDAGPLRIGRYAEPFALLVAQLAYEGKQGPELAYRLEWPRS
jgi:predicted dinucleotide-binding enzyme